jgi:hypothetical protein
MMATEQPSLKLLSETISIILRIFLLRLNLSADHCTRNTRSIFFILVLAGMLCINIGICKSADGESGSAESLSGTCIESKPAGTKVSGSGPHEVIVETNSAPGINKGTIFRPADLGGKERYPIFIWGEGGCSQNGLSNAAAMAEIASHGYFVIADGTPNGRGNIRMGSGNMEAMGMPMIAYIDWAVSENEKPCSAYYHSLDTKKISTNGFSCGGLMAIGTVGDPRITAWGITSSGMARVNDDFYDLVKKPVLFVEGGPSDIAYKGGTKGYENISKLEVPVLWFSRELGHGAICSSLAAETSQGSFLRGSTGG